MTPNILEQAIKNVSAESGFPIPQVADAYFDESHHHHGAIKAEVNAEVAKLLANNAPTATPPTESVERMTAQ